MMQPSQPVNILSLGEMGVQNMGVRQAAACPAASSAMRPPPFCILEIDTLSISLGSDLPSKYVVRTCTRTHGFHRRRCAILRIHWSRIGLRTNLQWKKWTAPRAHSHLARGGPASVTTCRYERTFERSLRGSRHCSAPLPPPTDQTPTRGPPTAPPL